MVSTTALSQRAANTIAFAKAASTMFAMDEMLSHRPGQLKMPRPDAYNQTADVRSASDADQHRKTVSDCFGERAPSSGRWPMAAVLRNRSLAWRFSGGSDDWKWPAA
jgi:hypothetical protein